jgi:predicted RecA/RadA family phage recombinase
MANPTQYNEWETSNSYIAGGTAVMLGSMIAIAIKSLFSGIKRAGKYP